MTISVEMATAMYTAIKEHHEQKADDRCIEDDDKLYAAAGLPPVDRNVGDKVEMLLNCARFIARRCEGGKWPTYAELETALQRIAEIRCAVPGHSVAVGCQAASIAIAALGELK